MSSRVVTLGVWLTAVATFASAPADSGLLATRYTAAVAAWHQGKLGPASEELELLALHYPALADRCRYEAGLVFEQRGASRKAASLLATVSADSYFFAEARLALARVLRAQGQLEDAASALQPLLGSPVARGVRLRALSEAATLASLQHDEAARLAALAQLALGGRTAALAAQARLDGGVGLALVARADTLLDRGRCRDAARAGRHAAVAQPDGPLGCVAQLLLAEAGACLGEDVAARLQGLAASCAGPELQARALMTLGAVQARAGDDAAAVDAFRASARLQPGTSQATEALFAAFWVGWKRSPAQASTVELTQLEALPPGALSAQDRARAHYWRARVAQQRGSAEEESALLAELCLQHPSTWYARLARERLTELDPERASLVALGAVEPEPLSTSAEATGLLPGIEAVKLGLLDGPAELMALARREPSRSKNGVVVEVLAAAGQPRVAHQFARAVLRESLGGERQSALVWEAAFPTPFSQAIARYADDAAVPANLLQGLVREESAFNPAARSHVGALGLTQLMPRTAQAVALKQGQPLQHLSELYEPERNLQIGAHYLGELLRRFDGEAAFAAAAYNGGPTRVARWLKQRPQVSLDEWVEQIPIDETRNYVKDVLASAGVYQQVLSRRPQLASADVTP